MSEVKGGKGTNVSRIKWLLLVKQHSACSTLGELSASQNVLVPSLSPFQGSGVWGVCDGDQSSQSSQSLSRTVSRLQSSDL